MRRDRMLPAGEVRRVLRGLALALDSARRDGVIHRDLKAENILLEGSASSAMTGGRAFGTPHYMWPEQPAGELDIDGRSDLYSLGVLGYYMLSGRLPFDARTFEALAAKHIAETHAPLGELAPNAPAELCDPFETCLRKDREARYRNSSGR